MGAHQVRRYEPGDSAASEPRGSSLRALHSQTELPYPEAPTTDLRERLQATLAGAYELETELGGGGMSRVFLAHETALGRKVVVKVLLPTLAAGVSAERFRREILLVARLQHPHIVPVLTAGESNGLPWFTMPYVQGETLRARIAREGELPISEAVRLLREIASALSYAHANGVIHRDIKPDNVLLSAGSPVVADFGVAKALSESVTDGDRSHLTSLGIALGTPAYMAPEQAAADQSMDHRVDIYALGVVAYEMIAGRPPFIARTPQAMLAAHFTETPAPLESHRPSVPAALAALVMRCLEKHAADRPTSADEILHVLDSMTTPSGGMTPTTGFRRPRRRGEDAGAVGKGIAWHWIAAGVTAAAVIGAMILPLRTPAGGPAAADPAPATALAPEPVVPLVPTAESATAAQHLEPTEPAEPPSRRAAEPPAAEPPSRQPATPLPRRNARVGPAPATPAPDTMLMVRLRLAAIEVRRSAESAGAPAAALARGESLLARGDSLSRASRPDEAAIAYSSAGAAWASARADAAPAAPAARESIVERQAAPAQPPAPPRPDARPAADSIVAAYAAAIESRSTARIRAVYPGLTAAQERDWRAFFDAVDAVQATLRVTGVQVTDDVAEATATGEYVFENATTRRTERQPATVRLTLRRAEDGSWRLAGVR